eukprot:6464701-Amphidinium_carterae.1
MECPSLFEGHTLERELEGVRCSECGKGTSDIAGRPRWSYFREFRCVPKRINVVEAGLGDSLCKPSHFSWKRQGRLRSGRDVPPAVPGQ